MRVKLGEKPKKPRANPRRCAPYRLVRRYSAVCTSWVSTTTNLRTIIYIQHNSSYISDALRRRGGRRAAGSAGGPRIDPRSFPLLVYSILRPNLPQSTYIPSLIPIIPCSVLIPINSCNSTGTLMGTGWAGTRTQNLSYYSTTLYHLRYPAYASRLTI